MYKLSFFIALAIAAAVNAGRICYFEDVVGKACSHFISAYDMTGVATEYDLSIVNDDIKSACDCIKACKKTAQPAIPGSTNLPTTADIVPARCTLISLLPRLSISNSMWVRLLTSCPCKPSITRRMAR